MILLNNSTQLGSARLESEKKVRDTIIQRPARDDASLSSEWFLLSLSPIPKYNYTLLGGPSCLQLERERIKLSLVLVLAANKVEARSRVKFRHCFTTPVAIYSILARL